MDERILGADGPLTAFEARTTIWRGSFRLCPSRDSSFGDRVLVPLSRPTVTTDDPSPSLQHSWGVTCLVEGCCLNRLVFTVVKVLILWTGPLFRESVLSTPTPVPTPRTPVPRRTSKSVRTDQGVNRAVPGAETLGLRIV